MFRTLFIIVRDKLHKHGKFIHRKTHGNVKESEMRINIILLWEYNIKITIQFLSCEYVCDLTKNDAHSLGTINIKKTQIYVHYLTRNAQLLIIVIHAWISSTCFIVCSKSTYLKKYVCWIIWSGRIVFKILIW